MPPQLSPHSQRSTSCGSLQCLSPAHLRGTPAPPSLSGQSWAPGRPQVSDTGARENDPGWGDGGRGGGRQRERERHCGGLGSKPRKRKKQGDKTTRRRGDRQTPVAQTSRPGSGGGDWRRRGLAEAGARRPLDLPLAARQTQPRPVGRTQPGPRPAPSRPRRGGPSGLSRLATPQKLQGTCPFFSDHHPLQCSPEFGSGPGPTAAPTGRAAPWLRPSPFHFLPLPVSPQSPSPKLLSAGLPVS